MVIKYQSFILMYLIFIKIGNNQTLLTIAQISTAFTVPLAMSRISNSCFPTSVIIPLQTDYHNRKYCNIITKSTLYQMTRQKLYFNVYNLNTTFTFGAMKYLHK